MNYLAHCYLAEATPAALIGSLAPDFNRGGCFAPADPAIRDAMQEHLAIDQFTDAHPATIAIRTLYAKHFRHLGGVLADVTYDHFLAAQWPRFHAGQLVPFTASVYRTLEENAALCPELLQECLPRMRQQNWLASYADLEGVAETLRRMSHRLSSKPRMQDAVVILETNYAELRGHFDDFFPQLQAHVKERRKT